MHTAQSSAPQFARSSIQVVLLDSMTPGLAPGLGWHMAGAYHDLLHLLCPCQVWMWFRPKGKGMDAADDIRRVPLSQETMCMSFTQFLQV